MIEGKDIAHHQEEGFGLSGLIVLFGVGRQEGMLTPELKRLCNEFYRHSMAD